MSLEKEAVTVVVLETPVAPGAGVWPVTLGGTGAVAAVVNDQLTGAASGTPSLAAIAVVRCAVYVVPSASGADGASVAVLDGPL